MFLFVPPLFGVSFLRINLPCLLKQALKQQARLQRLYLAAFTQDSLRLRLRVMVLF
jgi:hypothetical protein